jgi:hypothetical protein
MVQFIMYTRHTDSKSLVAYSSVVQTDIVAGGFINRNICLHTDISCTVKMYSCGSDGISVVGKGLRSDRRKCCFFACIYRHKLAVCIYNTSRILQLY